MPSITVSIPKELKTEMDILEEVNWSAVARQAFAERVVELQAIRKFKKNSTATEEEAIALGRLLKQNR